MGGAQMGSRFDGGEGFDVDPTKLTIDDIHDLYYASPFILATVAERARTANNEGLSAFIGGIAAARMLEPLINEGTRRRPEYVHPSGNSRAAYMGVVSTVLGRGAVAGFANGITG